MLLTGGTVVGGTAVTSLPSVVCSSGAPVPVPEVESSVAPVPGLSVAPAAPVGAVFCVPVSAERDRSHYDDVIMTMLASQITSLTVVYSIVYSGVNQRKHQSSKSLAFVREIHRGPVNFPHKWPVTRKMFPFDDVIMTFSSAAQLLNRC